MRRTMVAKAREAALKNYYLLMQYNPFKYNEDKKAEKYYEFLLNISKEGKYVTVGVYNENVIITINGAALRLKQ